MEDMKNENLTDLLRIDSRKEEERITGFIRKQLKELKRDGAVIGLSGGLDSSTCAYLLERAVGRDRILALILPERDSSPINMEHARLVASNLHLKTIETDLTELLDKMGVYRIGPKEIRTEKDMKGVEEKLGLGDRIFGPHLIFEQFAMTYGQEEKLLAKLAGKALHKGRCELNAFGYTKVRMRMLCLSYHAWLNNYAIIGTLDKSEWSIGLFDVHGDGVCELAILRHLYKTQIRQLAQDIGIPAGITQKQSSGDLYGNISWERGMGMSYLQLDQILYGLENGYTDNQLADVVPVKTVETVRRNIGIANLIRRLPLTLDE